MAEVKSRRRSSAVMIMALFLLTVMTLAAGGLALHGFFVTGWLLPYWNAMTDAQASIISQLIFFLAVAWGSLLVPLLFGSQLRSLREAADDAEKTYNEIKQKLEDSIADSKRQFSSISRYQQMALGYFASEGVFSDLDDEQKKTFVETAWHSVEPKVQHALEQLHGKTRQWVRQKKWRSSEWWERVRESGALGDRFVEFKTISDVKWSIIQGAVPTFAQLKSVNDSLKAVQDFVSPLDLEVNGGAAIMSPPRDGTQQAQAQLPQ